MSSNTAYRGERHDDYRRYHDESRDEYDEYDDYEDDVWQTAIAQSSTTDRNAPSALGCSFCGDIIRYAMKFRVLDEEEPPSEHPHFHMEKEDNRGDLIRRAKTCKICAVVLSATNDVRSSSGSTARVPVDNDFIEDPDDCEIWWEFGRPRAKYDRPMLCIVDSGYGHVFFKFRQTLSFFLESLSLAATESMRPSEYVSYPVLRAWYDKCLGHGGTLQGLFLFDDLQSTSIRLIDVENECLCDVPTSEDYLALSYVWGTSQVDDDKLTSRNIHQLYTPRSVSRLLGLTRTVRDAIEVTKSLGFHYLFVDRLCIMQDSSKDKATYVEAMHEIYNKANITIVAAAGTSAQAGLPGTLGTPRTQNRLYHPRQCVKLDQERDLVRVYEDEFPPADLVQKHLEDSVWAMRGWTYQEEKLSERMLIFTDQMVFWKCSHMTLYEDCAHDLHEHLSDGLVDMRATDAFGRDAFWWMRKKDADSGLTALDSSDFENHVYSKKRDDWISLVFRLRVQDFCERKLTYQDDVARAFNGMVEAFKIVYEPLSVHHGLLTRSLPSELTWGCAGCVSQSHSIHDRHLGLRTTPAHPQGVSAFPTWSWHAWQDQPSWISHQRRPKESMREMEQDMAMTTDMYVGIGDPPNIELVYWETRNITWREHGGDFTPPMWMTQHPLRGNALIFIALVCDFYVCPDRPLSTLNRLSDLGILLSGAGDITVSDWLQQPSVSAFARPLGVVCLSYFDQQQSSSASSRNYSYTHTNTNTNTTIQMATMLLVSYQTIQGNKVAFREGLFTCTASSFRNAETSFQPETIFLC